MKLNFLAKDARELSCNALVMRNTKSDKWVKYALKAIKKDIKTASKAAKFDSVTNFSYPTDNKLRNCLGWKIRFKRPEVSHKLIQFYLEEAFKEAGYNYSVWFNEPTDTFRIYLRWDSEKGEYNNGEKD